MRIQKEKIESQKKVQRRIFVWNITFLATHTPYVICCLIFQLLPGGIRGAGWVGSGSINRAYFIITYRCNLK